MFGRTGKAVKITVHAHFYLPLTLESSKFSRDRNRSKNCRKSMFTTKKCRAHAK